MNHVKRIKRAIATILTVGACLFGSGLGGCFVEPVRNGLDCVVENRSVACQGGFSFPFPGDD